VVLVFFVSSLVWRMRRSPAGKRVDVAKLPSTSRQMLPNITTVNKSVVRTPCQGSLPQSAAVRPAPPESLKQIEQEMMGRLSKNNFTAALSMYRSCERDGHDAHLGAEVHLAFIQSAIRVGKLDVVDRMIRKIKMNGMEVSAEFLRVVCKLLSSRKHFNIIITVHAVWGRSLPVDRIIFSCIVNACLATGSYDRGLSALEQWSACGNIGVNDYVLFFRTYAAVGDMDRAEKLFLDLGRKTSTLMLNLVILTCVKGNAPDRAWSNLVKAGELEKGQREKMLDVVSYNTVIKGFAQSCLHDRCFACFEDMASRGLEPDDITRKLMSRM